MKHLKQQFTLMVSHRLQNLLEDIEAVLKISLPWQQISAFLQNDWRYLKLSSAFVFLPPLWNDIISFFAPNRQGMEFKRSVEKISYYLEWPQNKSKLHYPQEVVRNVGVWPLELSFEKACCALCELLSDCVQGLLKWSRLRQWGFTSPVCSSTVGTKFLYLGFLLNSALM